jgi:AcrR family transcriptional regulator
MPHRERSGAGDPARVLELLWGGERSGPRRGRRPALSSEKIVEPAFATADREGLEALTMRRLAEALAVAPMALYTYVPGKAELLDLMLDRVYAEMSRSRWPGDWRGRLTAVARDNRALYEAHPWAAMVATGRPPRGPGLMAKYEHELSAFGETSLDDLQIDAALTFLLDFVRAWAIAAHDVRATRRETGITDEQWWEANAPLLERVLDPDAYPTAARVGTAAGAAHGSAYSPGHAWEFGLERVLDGLAALIERPRGRPAPEPRSASARSD